MSGFEVVLFAGLLFLASINAASLVWAFYLDRRLRQRPVPKNYDVHVEGSKVFKEVELDEVEKEAVDELHEIINNAAKELSSSLSQTISKVSASVEQHIKEVSESQFVEYQKFLTESFQRNEAAMAEVESYAAEKRKNVNEILKASVQKEYNAKLAAFEDRMSDVVTSYIVDSLEVNADMSAQVDAIVESLEKHKEDIKQDIAA